MELFVFICAGAMILGGALGVILRSHPVHAALSLVLTLFGVAVLFVSQHAEFLAAAQVIVYAGAIVVLFLFVIMLLGVDKAEDLRIEPFRIQRPLAVLVGGSIVALVSIAAISSRKVPVKAVPVDQGVGAVPKGSPDEGIRRIARDLFTDHVFAFELTSVLLVIAVVGTVLLARRPPKADRDIESTGATP